jgi:hypothetical protein
MAFHFVYSRDKGRLTMGSSTSWESLRNDPRLVQLRNLSGQVAELARAAKIDVAAGCMLLAILTSACRSNSGDKDEPKANRSTFRSMELKKKTTVIEEPDGRVHFESGG